MCPGRALYCNRKVDDMKTDLQLLHLFKGKGSTYPPRISRIARIGDFLTAQLHIYTLYAKSPNMTNYRPSFAAHTPAADDSIKDFVANFYSTSDTPGKNAEWVEFFQPDATIMLEKKKATGSKGMLVALRIAYSTHDNWSLTQS